MAGENEQSDEYAERLRQGTIRYFEERKERAAARRAAFTGRHWFVTVLGRYPDVPAFEIALGIRLDPVAQIPIGDELFSAIRFPGQARAIRAQVHVPNHELVIDAESDMSFRDAVEIGRHVTDALSIRARRDIYATAVADHSWASLAAAPANGVQAFEIANYDDAMERQRNRIFGGAITMGDLEWVRGHHASFVALRKQARFRVAVEAYIDHGLQENARMATATVWSGIEAILGIAQESGHRLAMYAAAMLEPRGNERLALFERLTGMYAIRSKAVHGSAGRKDRDDQFIGHSVEARGILARLLCTIIERGSIPSQDELNKQVFT